MDMDQKQKIVLMAYLRGISNISAHANGWHWNTCIEFPDRHFDHSRAKPCVIHVVQFSGDVLALSIYTALSFFRNCTGIVLFSF